MIMDIFDDFSSDRTNDDPYEFGACVRCLTLKPNPDLPDLCALCSMTCDRIVKEDNSNRICH